MSGRTTARGGFTFIETIVSIVIVSLVFAALVPATLRATSSLHSLSTAANELYRIADTYATFRSACRRTAVPLWEPSGSALNQSGATWKIAELDGNADKLWSVTTNATSLVVTDDRGEHSCPASNPDINPIVLYDRTVGLEVDFQAMSLPWRWKEYFASSGF